MKRFSRLLVVAAIVGLVASTVVLASHDTTWPKMPKMRLGQPYDRSQLFSHNDDTHASVMMPTVVMDDELGGIGGAAGATAPGDDLGRGSGKLTGSILPGTGGMAMSTPRERAEREVKRLISALD